MQRAYTPKRPPNFKRLAIVGAVALVFLFILIRVINIISVVGVSDTKFVGDVTVNGNSFTGMTMEESLTVTEQMLTQWTEEQFTFTYQDYSKTFTRGMAGADIDYATQLTNAWNLGHVGGVFERYKRLRSIGNNPINLVAPVTYDETVVDTFVDAICADLDIEAVDALVVPDVNAPLVVNESSVGQKVNREQLRAQVVALITTTDEIDTTIPVETVFPTVSSDALGFQLIAQFSTDVSFRGYKSRSNVRLALNAFNGMVVSPGETVSFNEVVGPRTEERGFMTAPEYAGDTTTSGVGGGVCQASTTLYDALVMAGMSVVERNQHTMVVTYTQPSLDAAVSYPSKDLVFKNDTEYPVYIYTSVTKEEATVMIYGHKPPNFYHLESVVIEQNRTSTRKVYIDDTEGTYVYFVNDPPVLQAEGKPGCTTEGWIVTYDWETQQEVDRVQVSRDTYVAGASVYYRGTHSAVGTNQQY